MSLNTTESSNKPWTKRALGALTIVLLGAVPVLGLTVLSPGLFAASQAGKGKTDAGVSANPFTFNAPTVSLQRQKSEAEERPPASAEKGKASRENAFVLTDWEYTWCFQFFHRHRGVQKSFQNSDFQLLLFILLFEIQSRHHHHDHHHHHHHHKPPKSPHK